MSDDVRYDRLYRTPNSEAYLISEDEEAVARVDLHLGGPVVYGLLIVERELDEQAITDLIDRIDEDLVASANVPRDDFIVAVYHGREVGVYNDSHGVDDEELDRDE
jgi:hypothetical protein